MMRFGVVLCFNFVFLDCGDVVIGLVWSGWDMMYLYFVVGGGGGNFCIIGLVLFEWWFLNFGVSGCWFCGMGIIIVNLILDV